MKKINENKVKVRNKVYITKPSPKDRCKDCAFMDSPNCFDIECHNKIWVPEVVINEESIEENIKRDKLFKLIDKDTDEFVYEEYTEDFITTLIKNEDKVIEILCN